MPDYKYVATNLTDLHKEPSFVSELLTQVLNATRLEILEQNDKWLRVRQDDGYEGWAFGPYLTDASPEPATHITWGIEIYRKPVTKVGEEGAFVPVTRLPVTTSVRLIEKRGQWSHIAVCAGTVLPSGWVQSSLLRPLSELPMKSADARKEVLRAARGLTGTYYLWGGNSDWGTDCSGLTQLAHRLAGYTLPRDARLQFPAGKAVSEPFQPGDLLFFHSEMNKEKITHVGISTGGWNMIHSSRSRNGVYEEDVQGNENLRKTFAGARSFLT